MGNGMNKILPGLYVGNFRDARNLDSLNENKITHILSIHDHAKPLHQDRIYLCIAASDNAAQDLTQYFPQCIEFIHEARLSGGAVLVHCLAGMSRSVSVTVAYIMTVTTLSWREALNSVRGARKCANPNFGFQKQLQTYEYELLEKERERISQLYPENPFSDESDCRRLLALHHDWVLTGDDSLYPLPHNAYAQRNNHQSQHGAVQPTASLTTGSIQTIFNGLQNKNIPHNNRQNDNGRNYGELSSASSSLNSIDLFTSKSERDIAESNSGQSAEKVTPEGKTEQVSSEAKVEHVEEELKKL